MLSMDNTSVVEAEDGFDYWHHVTCSNFSLSQCARSPGRAFRARIASRRFGPLALSDTSMHAEGGVRMTRGPAEIRKDPRDHFMVFLVTHGSIDVAQGDRRASASAGDLFVYDQTMPFSLDFHRPRSILVNVPRALMLSQAPGMRDMTARRLPGTSKMGALAGSLLRQMSGLDGSANRAGDRLAAAAMDILATALESELSGNENLQQNSHRLLPKVQRYILDHLHEDDLDLQSIAEAQNIAPRTLNRIFASEGTTPIRWLWQQRLITSYRALSEGHVDSITAAALSAGFRDMSHFSRAFKREFGCLPNTVRRGR